MTDADADADIPTVAEKKITTLMVMLVLDSTTAHAQDINPSATLHEVHAAFIPQNMWDWKY